MRTVCTDNHQVGRIVGRLGRDFACRLSTANRDVHWGGVQELGEMCPEPALRSIDNIGNQLDIDEKVAQQPWPLSVPWATVRTGTCVCFLAQGRSVYVALRFDDEHRD